MNTEQELLDKAIAYHLENAFQEAYNHYTQALQVNPFSHHALHLRGLLMLQNGLIKLGREGLQQALALRPDYSEALHNLAVFDASAALKTQREHDSVPVVPEYPRFAHDTVDGWRHLRMVEFVKCFAGGNDQWLTLGDAFGHDATMLKLMGAEHVMASNLETSNLAQGHAAGIVGAFRQLNAEEIDLPSDSVDYVLCKEALHHMPRPMAAIYEMVRVARKGVFFIEPQDKLIDWPTGKSRGYYRDIVPADMVGEKVMFLRETDDQPLTGMYVDWWEDGPFNYVYTFSKREIRKIALGMGLSAFATKPFNDFYNADWAAEKMAPDSEGLRKTQEQIALHDVACQAVGTPYSYITGMLFKQTPAPDVMQQLTALGYQVTITPTRYLPIQWPTIGA